MFAGGSGDSDRLDHRVGKEFFQTLITAAVEFFCQFCRRIKIEVKHPDQCGIVQLTDGAGVKIGDHTGADDAETDFLNIHFELFSGKFYCIQTVNLLQDCFRQLKRIQKFLMLIVKVVPGIEDTVLKFS